MKKLNRYLSLCTIIITIGSLTSSYIQAKNQLPAEKDAFIDQYTALQATRAKKAKTIQFTPDKKFGGGAAQGQFDHKANTATITYNGKIFEFTNIIEDRNPTLAQVAKKKEIPADLVDIGSYTKRLSRGMPITMYVYGQLVEDKDAEENNQII